MKPGAGAFPAALYSQQQHMERVWLERAKRLSQRSVIGEGRDAFSVIVVGIGKERYGVDLSDVAEVLPPIRATPVPGAAAVFSGVLNVHGEIRPVIDLSRLLGMEPVQKSGLARVILLRKEGREMGLQIDSVEQIRWIDSAEVQSAGNGAAGSAQQITSRHIKGSTQDLLMLLSTDELFASYKQE